jgi:hypothetical protein
MLGSILSTQQIGCSAGKVAHGISMRWAKKNSDTTRTHHLAVCPANKFWRDPLENFNLARL